MGATSIRARRDRGEWPAVAEPNAHAAIRVDGALPGEICLVESAHCGVPELGARALSLEYLRSQSAP